jgi:outer membrane receptor protein involved in Fe transport
LHRGTSKTDYGSNLYFTRIVSEKHNITAGIESRNGNVFSREDYKTSTDLIKYSGFLSLVGVYIQDSYSIVPKLNINAGARMDYAKFYKGNMFVSEPSSVTGYESDINEILNENSWYSVNPKISIKYFINQQINSYISYSTGFMPPKLDDLCKTGKINKGFKIANPDLLPEKLSNYEIGLSGHLLENLNFQMSGYYSIGKDFHYFVNTGNTIITATGEEKPVYKRENIGMVEISGAELELKYSLNNNLMIKASYAYNNSTIKEYAVSDTTEDLSGNKLLEVPAHLFSTDIQYTNPDLFNASLSYNYVGSQWADDENTQLLEPYGLINIKISKSFKKYLNVYIDIQNLLNKIYIDRKGNLPPGRFWMAGIILKI